MKDYNIEQLKAAIFDSMDPEEIVDALQLSAMDILDAFQHVLEQPEFTSKFEDLMEEYEDE